MQRSSKKRRRRSEKSGPVTWAEATRKKKESRRTGGGYPPNAISQVEEKGARIIGKTPINRIEGGINTHESVAFE